MRVVEFAMLDAQYANPVWICQHAPLRPGALVTHPIRLAVQIHPQHASYSALRDAAVEAGMRLPKVRH